MKSLIPISLIVVLVLAVGWILGSSDNDLLQQQDKKRGGGFTLNSSNGPVSLNDFEGKVVLLYFGYTWCPDICPTNLAMMSAAFGEISDSNQELMKRIQGIFISVDPGRDSPERLSEYTNFFHENIIGLTGSREQIDDLATRYGVGYRIVKNEESATNYVVDHTSETYVIDTRGEWVDTLPHAAPPEDITKSVMALLK